MREFLTDKEYVLFVKNVERLCRSSIEYKEWVQNCRENGGFQCALTYVTIDDATIEIHHTPFTLYDLVETAIINIKWDTTFDLCNWVIKLHSDDYVGWCPLSKTSHELVHADNIVIPLDLVKGNYMKLFDICKLPEAVNDRVSIRIAEMKKRQENVFLGEQTIKR